MHCKLFYIQFFLGGGKCILASDYKLQNHVIVVVVLSRCIDWFCTSCVVLQFYIKFFLADGTMCRAHAYNWVTIHLLMIQICASRLFWALFYIHFFLVDGTMRMHTRVILWLELQPSICSVATKIALHLDLASINRQFVNFFHCKKMLCILLLPHLLGNLHHIFIRSWFAKKLIRLIFTCYGNKSF